MKLRVRNGLLVPLLLAALALSAAPEVATYAFGARPQGRILTFAAGAGSRGLAWQTSTEITASEVRLVPGAATPADFLSAPLVYTGSCTRVALPTTHCHRVIIDRLAPGDYSCRIGGEGRYAYCRLQVKAPGETVTVVNFNDLQTSDPARLGWAERALAAAAWAAGGADRVDFLLNGGDLVDGGLRRTAASGQLAGRSVEWGVIADLLTAAYPSAPIVSASGNHDGDDYGERMPIRYPEGVVPGCESLDYGNVHMATVPFVAGGWNERSERVYAWLERDLAANRARGRSDWTIVVTHWGPYTTGDHAVLEPESAQLAVRLGGLCARHRVDLVLQAHDHTCSKTLPYRWSGPGWTTRPGDEATVNFRPQSAELDGERYDLDPQGTYYLSAGCIGPRVGENAAYACPSGAVSYVTRAVRIETGRLAVDSRWGRRGDAASADLPRSVFGLLRITGKRLRYDWYVVEPDGSYVPYDRLRVAKTTPSPE
ncbi:MAG: metallophosphoesterase family protein [Kiritimatiellia bacterium]